MAFLALFFYIQVEMKRKDEDKKDTRELSDHAHHDQDPSLNLCDCNPTLSESIFLVFDQT